MDQYVGLPKILNETSPIHYGPHDKVVELAEICRLRYSKWGGRWESFWDMGRFSKKSDKIWRRRGSRLRSNLISCKTIKNLKSTKSALKVTSKYFSLQSKYFFLHPSRYEAIPSRSHFNPSIFQISQINLKIFQKLNNGIFHFDPSLFDFYPSRFH